MSENITTLVDRALAAWNNHDAPTYAAQYSQDAVARIIPTDQILHGRQQLQAMAAAYLHAFPDLEIQPRHTYQCGEAVRVIESTLTATHQGTFMDIPPTHRSVELLTCSIFTLGNDQLIGQETLYFDTITLLRQLNVLPHGVDTAS